MELWMIVSFMRPLPFRSGLAVSSDLGNRVGGTRQICPRPPADGNSDTMARNSWTSALAPERRLNGGGRCQMRILLLLLLLCSCAPPALADRLAFNADT